MVHTTYDYLALLCARATASFMLLFLSHANVLKNVLKIMISQIDNQRGGGIGGVGEGWIRWREGCEVSNQLGIPVYSLYNIAENSDQLQKMKY